MRSSEYGIVKKRSDKTRTHEPMGSTLIEQRKMADPERALRIDALAAAIMREWRDEKLQNEATASARRRRK